MKWNKQWLTVAIAAALTACAAAPFVAQQPTAPTKDEVSLRAAMERETVQGDLKGAIEAYKKLENSKDRSVAARALLRMAESYRKLGDAQSREVYERIVLRFADQGDVAALARARMAALRTNTLGESAPTARQIWRGLDVSQTGTPSPDGRFLSFTADSDLAVRDLVTGTSRRLTNTGGWAASGDYVNVSVISPDGKQVAYDWFVEKDFKNELRVIPLSSGDSARPKAVSRFDRTEYMRPFGWTPDGKRVFVMRFVSNANSIGSVSIEDGSFQSIKSLEWRNPSRLAVSNDGRYIAYDAPAADNIAPRDIFVISTDGSREVTAVEGPANDFSPLWSPDNSQLIFLSDRTGIDSLWTVAMENGRPKGVPHSVKGGVQPSTLLGITRAGTLYYGVRAIESQNIHVVEVNERMLATTSSVPATGRFIAGNGAPSWSRDGAYLAYYSLRNPAVLVVQTLKTAEERIVPLPVGVSTTPPRWFPDNRSVLILARSAQGPGSAFYRLELDTGKTEQLMTVGRGIGAYDLSPDGKTVFYSFQSSGSPGSTGFNTGRLMRFDIGSNHEVELKKDEWFINLAVSPDGSELAYLKSMRNDALRDAGEYPSVIEVMPAAGGPSREVFRNPIWLTGVRYGNLAWTPNGRSLVFVQDDGEFWTVSASGGKPEKMGVSRPKGRVDGVKFPAIHPDGRRMVFAALETDGAEVWALERFLTSENVPK